MFQLLLACTILSLASIVSAGIGPITDLTISNAQISPDGYRRDAIVTNGVFPAPLITGEKVCMVSYPILAPCSQYLQGDRFLINVIDRLTNHTMWKTTSIVSVLSKSYNTSS